MSKNVFSQNVDVFEHINKKEFFQRDREKIPFPQIWTQIKKCAFPRNADIYPDMNKERFYSKWSFFEMLIFLSI